MEKVQAVGMSEIHILPDECAGILWVHSKLAAGSETNTNNFIQKTKLCLTEEKEETLVLEHQWIFLMDVCSVFDLFFLFPVSFLYLQRSLIKL